MSPLVSIGILGQQILRSQDRDASEVIKRLPGTTIIDDRFIVIRGLAQRYNAVWPNNTATPSSEADAKSFSFDVIPAAMIEKMIIVKSPAPERPADFSGGFVKITTVNLPEKNSFFVSYGTALAEGTTNNNFLSYKQNSTGILGYDNGFRSLPKSMPSSLNIYESATNPEIQNKITQLGQELNKTWIPVIGNALSDQRFSLGFNKRITATWFTSANRNNSVLGTNDLLMVTNPFNLTAPNFLPLAGSPLLTGASFTNSRLTDSFFTPVTYKGAFGTTNWTAGWCNWDPQNTVY